MHKRQPHCVVRSDLEINSAGYEITAYGINDTSFMLWLFGEKKENRKTSIRSVIKAVACFDDSAWRWRRLRGD